MSTRREVVLAGAAMLLTGPALAGAPRIATPAQVAGPFAPVDWSGDVDWDLVHIEGRSRDAYGQVCHVVGRVLDIAGEPVAGARLSIWQADAFGRYHHPRERWADPDPYFRGFGRTVSGADGAYRFRTVTPVPYQGRTAHIHFQVAATGHRPLTTQMYLAGNPRNRRDGLFMGLDEARRGLLEAPVRPASDIEADAVRADFDVVLTPTV